jgi:hypothetical protein
MSSSRRESLPDWAIVFLLSLDLTYAGDEVTGMQALTLLNAVLVDL